MYALCFVYRVEPDSIRQCIDAVIDRYGQSLRDQETINLHLQDRVSQLKTQVSIDFI